MDIGRIIREIVRAYGDVMPRRIHGPLTGIEWRMNKATFAMLAKDYGFGSEPNLHYENATLLGLPVNVTDTDQVNLVLRVD